MRTNFGLLASAVLFGVLTTASAQQAHSPYAGEQSREIKALSPAEIQSLRNGEGMGLAKAAELNGYPGPKHVLELATQLELTPTQHAATQETFRTMSSKAKELGARIVEQERALDALFAGKSVSTESLARSIEQIGALQAELRTVHLQAHLAQVAVLTPHQVSRYRELRGYDSPASEHPHSHH